MFPVEWLHDILVLLSQSVTMDRLTKSGHASQVMLPCLSYANASEIQLQEETE
jgi:hypothetical protein